MPDLIRSIASLHALRPRLRSVVSPFFLRHGLVLGSRLPISVPPLFLPPILFLRSPRLILILQEKAARWVRAADDPPNQTLHARDIQICTATSRQSLFPRHYAADHRRSAGQDFKTIWHSPAEGLDGFVGRVRHSKGGKFFDERFRGQRRGRDSEHDEDRSDVHLKVETRWGCT